MGLLPAMDREKKEEQRLAFLDFQVKKRAEHRKGTLTSSINAVGNLY